MQKAAEILMVEDYEPDSQLILILLKKNRIANKVHIVRDGCEALDFLFCRNAYQNRNSKNPPDVVLLDIRLPKLDGWEVLRQMRQDVRTHNVPVILLSGSLFAEDLERGRELGALGCLPKPVQFEKLRELLTASGFVWMLMEQEPSKKISA